MPRVIHFEIHADDPERCSRFYQDVFGWQISQWDNHDYWLVTTGNEPEPGINGGIMKRRDPRGAVYNTVAVPWVDEYIERVIELGGKLVVPKMPIPGVGYLAYCQDTEGNVFGIMHEDKNAR